MNVRPPPPPPPPPPPRPLAADATATEQRVTSMNSATAMIADASDMAQELGLDAFRESANVVSDKVTPAFLWWVGEGGGDQYVTCGAFGRWPWFVVFPADATPHTHHSARAPASASLPGADAAVHGGGAL